jgi:hypothetical protein
MQYPCRVAVIFIASLAGAPQCLAAGQTIQASASFNAQVVITEDNDANISQQEKTLKRAMYERAARECDDLRATIALTCTISGVNVSTQINRSYGQPPTIYVNSNVSMQITLK